MSETTNLCRHCDRTSPEAFLCIQCGKDLAVHLVALAAYIPELGTQVTRQTRTSHTVSTRPAAVAEDAIAVEHRAVPPRLRSGTGLTTLVATPAQIDFTAADLLDQARNTLSTWCRVICENRGIEFASIFEEATA